MADHGREDANLERTWMERGRLEAVLGPSWGHLGASWGRLGASLGPLGALLGRLGRLSGPS